MSADKNVSINFMTANKAVTEFMAGLAKAPGNSYRELLRGISQVSARGITTSLTRMKYNSCKKTQMNHLHPQPSTSIWEEFMTGIYKLNLSIYRLHQNVMTLMVK